MESQLYTFDDRIQHIERIEFSVFGNDEIRSGSAFGKNSNGIDIAELYDNTEPRPGGLIDSRMGITDYHLLCGTCGLNTDDCVGHFGHIELAEPVYNIGYINHIIKILGCICLRCSRVLVYKNEAEIAEMIKNKSNKARFAEIRSLAKNITHCQRPEYDCGTPVSKIRKEIDKKKGIISIKVETSLSNMGKSAKKTDSQSITSQDDKKKIKQTLAPGDCFCILKNISDMDCYLLGMDPKKSRPEMLIYKAFPVPPVQVRPSVRGDFTITGTAENDLTHKLADIVRANLRLQKHKESQTEITAKFGQDNLHLLQYHAGAYFDNETLVVPKSEKPDRLFKSITSRLKGKEGRFRGNLMAKRTDFSARTVITGDATLDVDQLGMPLEIAMNLTYPDLVTKYNIEKLQKLVNNGPHIYPGANYVYPKSGNKRLFPIGLKYAKSGYMLKIGDIVERHILDNDIILFNRQPTLHKQSMMGHRVLVLRNPNMLTFRISAMVTTPYNADFDGDEMNLHCPQSIQTKVELQQIAQVKHQVIKPGDSRTTYGIVQDGLIGIYSLTNTPELNWRTVMNLLANTSIKGIKMEKKQYTGKEVTSFIIPDNINMQRSGVSIINGQMVNGFLSKDHVGAKKWNNLIHNVYVEYGADKTVDFLNNVQRLANYYNFYHGFTFGIGDIFIEDEHKQNFSRMIFTKQTEIRHLITEMENNPFLLDPSTFELSLQQNLGTVMPELGKIIFGVIESFSAFKTFLNSGAKGESVNAGQICGCIGQVIVDGKRVQKKLHNRTLVYFHQNDDTAEGRGFVSNSFLNGIRWEEFVFHLMGARENMIDTAIKTAQSGYVQRKLIKSLEDCMVHYDGTVRTGTNVIVQFVYGDNGIDTCKQIKYFVKLIELDNDTIRQTYIMDDSLLDLYCQMRDKLRTIYRDIRLDFIRLNNEYMIPINIVHITEKYRKQNSKSDLTQDYIIEKLESVIKHKDIYNLKESDIDYVTFIFKVALYDHLAPRKCIEQYKLTKKQFDEIIKEIIDKYERSIIEPGEMVGTIAAQAIGEPVTQMSVPGDTNIIVKNGQTVYNGRIDTFIDQFITIQTTSSIEVAISDWYIPSVSANGNVDWKQISHVSRHPVHGELMKIYTESGRTTSSTLSHSHLQLSSDGLIIPIKGRDLRIGHKIPVIKYVPHYSKMSTYQGTALTYDLGRYCGAYFITKWRINKYCPILNPSWWQFVLLFETNIPEFIFVADIQFIYGFLLSVIEYTSISQSDTYEIIKLEHSKRDIIHLLTYFGVMTSCDTKDNVILYNKLHLIGETVQQIFWDTIINIEISLPDQSMQVYDFTVPQNESFMVDCGILVHNTLSTFHFSGMGGGKSATNLGVGRITELLNNSRNTKTSLLTIHLTEEHRENIQAANKIASQLKYTILSHLVKKVDVLYDPDPFKENGIMNTDKVKHVFNSFSPIKNKCQVDISNLPWLIRIVLNREKLFNKNITLLDIKSKFCHNWEKRQSDLKSLKREEKILFEKIIACSILSNTDYDDEPIIHIRFDMNEFNNTIIVDMVDMILEKFKIKGINGITEIVDIQPERCVYFNSSGAVEYKTNYVIYAKGSNLIDLRNISGIDINRSYTNDISVIYEMFGIEATRHMLLKEFNSTFDSNGSVVNYQHLSILVDVMTNSGSIVSIDRHGVNRLDTDPLSRASFEQPIELLINAAVHQEVDEMRSVSSRIMAGRAIKGGTGLSGLLLDTDLLKSYNITANIEPISTIDDLANSSIYDDFVPTKTFKPK